MNRKRLTQTVGASLIGAIAIAGGWSARPLAHDDDTNHGMGSNASGDHPGALVQAVREATERFRDPAFAQAEGYAPLFGCVSGPDRGAMGQHFVNFPFVSDGRLDIAHPELVIYETLPSGHFKLTGAEFLVLKDQWDAAHAEPPQLMGQLFHLNEAPNRYRLPAFYSLHVWAWKENPFGAFVNWHPNVSCEAFTADAIPLPPDPGKDGLTSKQ
ncbi:MAG: hypothetical protein ACRD2I_02390 [Vicinamibacterales bacterium]